MALSIRRQAGNDDRVARNAERVDTVVDHHAFLKEQGLTADGKSEVEIAVVVRIEVRENLAELTFEEKCRHIGIEPVDIFNAAFIRIENARVPAFFRQGRKPDEDPLGGCQFQIGKDVDTARPELARIFNAVGIVANCGARVAEHPKRRLPDCPGRQFDTGRKISAGEEFLAALEDRRRRSGSSSSAMIGTASVLNSLEWWSPAIRGAGPLFSS